MAALKKQFSVLAGTLDAECSPAELAKLLAAETRWHYSQHFFAEAKGEEVIEDILRFTYSKKQRAVLGAQLQDEKNHTFIFKNIIANIGLDEQASRYSLGYSELVQQQTSLVEKVFVFQVITEAASAAYCAWRMLAMESDHQLWEADSLVFNDEQRHLVMGRSMLSICDRDELKQYLTPHRCAELIRELNTVCRSTVQFDLPYQASRTLEEETNRPIRSNLLDRMISRSVLREARNAEQMLAQLETTDKAKVGEL